MGKKIYIAIITIITITAIFLGLYIHVMGRSLAGIFGEINVSADVEEKNVEIADDFSSVSINLDISDVKIEYGEKASVEYCLPSALVPDISVVDGTLTVNSKKGVNIRIPSLKIKEAYLTIIIPEGTVLDDLGIGIDAGQLEVSSIESGNISLAVDAGNVKFHDLKTANFTIEVDAGNIDIADCEIGSLDAGVDAGNLSIRDSIIDTLTANVDAGNIDAENSTVNSGKCETDFGNISLHGNIGDVLTKTSLGNIDK